MSYAPYKGQKEETDNLIKRYRDRFINTTDYVNLSWDLNVWVGNNAVLESAGLFGEQHKIFYFENFAISDDLKIILTCSSQRKVLITWSTRKSKNAVDYVVTNNKISQQTQDVYIYRGADIYQIIIFLLMRLSSLLEEI